MRKLLASEAITQELLKELFNLVDGELIYKVRTNPRTLVGAKAGNTSGAGYLSVKLAGKRHYIHRLVWLYTTGEWPSTELDHIDGDKLNNRFSNLRQASRMENLRNSRLQANSTSGYRGVTRLVGGKWQAQANVAGKYVYLGSYATALEASMAYETFAKANHGEFYRPPTAV